MFQSPYGDLVSGKFFQSGVSPMTLKFQSPCGDLVSGKQT